MSSNHQVGYDEVGVGKRLDRFHEPLLLLGTVVIDVRRQGWVAKSNLIHLSQAAKLSHQAGPPQTDTVECTLILMSEWKTKLPDYLKGSSPN